MAAEHAQPQREERLLFVLRSERECLTIIITGKCAKNAAIIKPVLLLNTGFMRMLFLWHLAMMQSD
jgi:hypothetical protein